MRLSSTRMPRVCLVAIVSLVTSLALAPIAQGGAGKFRSAGVPEVSGPTISVDKSLLRMERAAQAGGENRMVSVIVRLADESLASNQGRVPGLAATNARTLGATRLNAKSTASVEYTKYLNARQADVATRIRAAAPNARVVNRFTTILNAMSVIVPADKVSEVAGLPGVRAVYEDKLLQLTTETSPAFIGAPTLWTQNGGQDKAGEGVIVGVLDTGIWPEHPSFNDPDPLGKAYAAPPPPLSGTRACEFSGGANPGAAFACNNKLIGADRFMATYEAVQGLLPAEYTTARDDNGHGTHTTSTAAGNRGVAASIFGQPLGTVSGIAPRAHVIMYRVCGQVGCFTSDSAAAVQEAIQDGVDVLNFSIAGGANPYGDVVSLAFLDAYNAGVFVAASAGNSGPGANTTDHREPWTMTVAASTHPRQFAGTASLVASNGDSLNLQGASITEALSTPAPIHVPATDTLCQTPFAPGSVAGMVVVCQRGINARVDKGFNVAQGGAVGMILYNAALLGIGTDNHFIPTVHLEVNEGNQLTAFLGSHTGVTATLSAGAAAPYADDVMAPFSSRGGSGLALGIAKPDVTAPGVQVLAGHTPTPATSTGGRPGQLFQAIQGTSMSSPHVAGAAALIRDLRPTWTPGQVKSALMMTAAGGVVKEDGTTPADPFDMGSGRIDLTRAGNPGLTIDETGANFVALQSHLWDANYPSVYVPDFLGKITVRRTLKSVRNATRTYKVVVKKPSDLKVTVPANIKVPAFGSAVLQIKLDGSNLPVGAVRHALIELKHSAEATLRLPITVVRDTSAIPLTKSCTPLQVRKTKRMDCTITITNTTFDDADVFMQDIIPAKLKLINGTIVNALKVGTNKVVFSGPLAGAEPPSVSIAPGASVAGYLPLSAFGVPAIGGVGDDTITNFNVPAFTYAGETYSSLGVSSNGYVVIGGGSGPDNSINNQNFPNAARPNNVLAPFWTDLNPAAAGAVRITTLTDGADTWIVVDWDGVREFSTAGNTHRFEVWIGIDGDANSGEDISFAYGANTGNGDGGFLSVGVENRFGNRGQNTYFNGAGTLPANGTELRVSSGAPAPGETRTILYSVTGNALGNWTNCAELSSDSYFGIQTACISGKVIP
jgi:subtilisin family serine protease